MDASPPRCTGGGPAADGGRARRLPPVPAADGQRRQLRHRRAARPPLRLHREEGQKELVWVEQNIYTREENLKGPKLIFLCNLWIEINLLYLI